MIKPYPLINEGRTMFDPLDRALDLLQRIQDALGTAETGEALVEVARNAHRAERELAALTLEAEQLPNEDLGEIAIKLINKRFGGSSTAMESTHETL